MFSWTVRLGNLLTISDRLKNLELGLSKLPEILIQQGRQDERITAMDLRLMSQGKRLDAQIERFNRAINNKIEKMDNS